MSGGGRGGLESLIPLGRGEQEFDTTYSDCVQYGRVQFWDSRYVENPDPFEWYYSYDMFRATINDALPNKEVLYSTALYSIQLHYFIRHRFTCYYVYLQGYVCLYYIYFSVSGFLPTASLFKSMNLISSLYLILYSMYKNIKKIQKQ